MENTKILLVEDDDNVAVTVERCLRREKFNVEVAGSGFQALQLAKHNPPDLVLLDVIMPGMDGYEVCRTMRANPSLNRIPIIFLTAKTREEDHINGFKAGGDDYINKPFNVEELVLRINAVLRRTYDKFPPTRNGSFDPKNISPAQQVDLFYVKVKGYTLNLNTFELVLPDKRKLLLTPIQFDILYNFMSHPGEIYSPARLLNVIWEYPPDAGSPDLVRVHIKNLRMRVEMDPSCPTFIETVPGYGYTVRETDQPLKEVNGHTAK